MTEYWILAQAPGAEQPGGVSSEPVTGEQTEIPVDSEPNTGTAGKQGPAFGNWLWIYVAIIMVFIFFAFRGPKKRQKEQQKMVSELQKNDRVRTIGGIIGTIVDVKDNEITLKVDESNNTKIKLFAGAVSENLSKSERK
ncbi:MAG: preprotein translocase subunit YajC [Planctomycetota bacterium]|jgi:preprotein translocase subunit YajC